MNEVYSAIQGEAELVGYRQVFVRLQGCNIRCQYCDQPDALQLGPTAGRRERTAGARDFEVAERIDLAEAVATLWRQCRHHSISITGGEPLAQSAALVPFLTLARRAGWPVMLETNATLPAALERVIELLDYVSADLKLNSVDGTSTAPQRQREFLEIAVARTVTWVKVVISSETVIEEFLAGIQLAHEVSPTMPIYIQPAAPYGNFAKAPSPQLVLDLQAAALEYHPITRVVPQTHKMINQL